MMTLGLWLRKLTTNPKEVGGAMVRLIKNSGAIANKENTWSEVGKGCRTMSRVGKDDRAMAKNDDAWAVKKINATTRKAGSRPRLRTAGPRSTRPWLMSGLGRTAGP